MAVTDDLTLWSLNTLDDTGAIVPRQKPVPIPLMDRLFTNGGAVSLASPSTFLEWAKARTRVPPWFDITEPRGRMLVGADRLASLLDRYEGVVSAPDRAAVAAYQTGPQPVDEAVRAAGDAWESYFFAGGARPMVKADLDSVVPPSGPLVAQLAPKDPPTFFLPLQEQKAVPNWATPGGLSRWRHRLGERALAELHALDRFLDDTSAKYGVRSDLMRRLIREESGGDPDAVGKAGEVGLMQLMPPTAKQLGVKDSRDPRANLEGGIRHFAGLLSEFGGNETHALAAYNAGSTAVKAALRLGRLGPQMVTYVRKFSDLLGGPGEVEARVAGPVAERLRDPSLGSALVLAVPPPPQPEDTGGLPPSTGVASPYPPLPVDRDYGALRQLTQRAIRELFPAIPPTKWFREIWGDEVRREQLDARVRELYWPDRLPAPTQVAEERPPLPPIAARPEPPLASRRAELPPRAGISGEPTLPEIREGRRPLERAGIEVPPTAPPMLPPPRGPVAVPPLPAVPARLPSIAMQGRPIAPEAPVALVPPQTRSMIPSAAEVRARPNVPALTPRPAELGRPSGTPVPRGTIAVAPAAPVVPPPSVTARPTMGKIVEALTPSVAEAGELPPPAVTDEDLAVAHQALVREQGQPPVTGEVTEEDLALAHRALVATEPRARAVFPETAPFPMPQPPRPRPQPVLTPAEAAPIERGEPVPTVQERIETTLAPLRQAWEPLRTERSAIEEEGAGLQREAERLEQLRGAVAAGKSAERFNAQVDAYNRRLTDHQAHAAAWQAAVEHLLASAPPDVAPLLDVPAQPLTLPLAPSAQLVEEQLRAPLVPSAEETPAPADLESVVGYGGRTVTPAERTANKFRRAIVFGVRTGAVGATARWLSNMVDDALGRPARTAGPVEPIGDTTWERAVALLASLGTDVPVFRLGALLVAAPARALLGSMRGTIEAELIAAGGAGLQGQAKAMAAKAVGNSFAAKEIVRESIPVWVRQGISAGLTPVQAARAARAAADAVMMTTLDPTAVSVGRAVIAAGAVGLEDTAREAAHQLAEHGRIVDPARVVTEGVTGVALGAGAGAISGVVSGEAVKVLSETAWWGAAQPVLKEHRMPTVEDFVAAGIPISVLHFAVREGQARVTGPQVRRIPEARRVDTGGPPRPEPPVEAPAPPPVVPRPADVGRRPRPRPVRPPPPAPAPVPPAPAPPAEAPPGLLPIDRSTMALDPRTGRGIVDPDDFLGWDPKTGYGVLKPGVTAPAPPAAPVRPVEAPPVPGEALPPAGPPVAPPEPVSAPPAPAEAPLPMEAPAAPVPPAAPAEAPPVPPTPPPGRVGGFTRTGVVEYRDLPPISTESRQVYTTGGESGRVVGEDAENFYVAHLAGSVARVAKYPKEFVTRSQAYWAIGSRIQTNEGPAEIIAGPRLDDRGFRTVGARFANGTEKQIPTRSPFITDMPTMAKAEAPAPEPGPPAAPAEAPPVPTAPPAAVPVVPTPPTGPRPGLTMGMLAEARRVEPRERVAPSAAGAARVPPRWVPRPVAALPQLASQAQAERIAGAAANLLNALQDKYGGRWPVGIPVAIQPEIRRFRQELRNSGIRRVPQGSNLEPEAKRWVDRAPVSVSPPAEPVAPPLAQEVPVTARPTEVPVAKPEVAPPEAPAPVPTDTVRSPEDVYRSGRARAAALYGTPREFDQVLSGVSEVLNGHISDPEQARQAIHEIANRWHDPLASLSASATLDQVGKAMDGKLLGDAQARPSYDAESVLRQTLVHSRFEPVEPTTRAQAQSRADELEREFNRDRERGSLAKVRPIPDAYLVRAAEVETILGRETDGVRLAREKAARYREAIDKYEQAMRDRLTELRDRAKEPVSAEVLARLDNPPPADQLAVRMVEELTRSTIDKMVEHAHLLGVDEGIRRLGEFAELSQKARAFIAPLDRATLADALRIVRGEDGVVRKYVPRPRELRASDVDEETKFGQDPRSGKTAKAYAAVEQGRRLWGTAHLAEYGDAPKGLPVGTWEPAAQMSKYIPTIPPELKPLEPVARGWKNDLDTMYLRLSDGQLSAVNARYWDHFTARHPEARAFQSDPSTPLVFKDGDTIIGIVMPMRIQTVPPGVRALADRMSGEVSFMAVEPEGEAVAQRGLPGVEMVMVGLQKAASIEGAPGLRLADTTDFYFTPERLRSLAQGPHLAPLASAAANAYQRLRDRLALDNARYTDSYFFGLSLDPRYYGLNFKFQGPSAVLLNAHANAAVIDNYVRNGLILPKDAPVEMARRLVDILLHEATHEEVRRHAKPDDLFAVAYVRNAEDTAELRAELAAELAQVLREGNVHATFRDEARQLAAERAGTRRAEPARPDLAIQAGAPRREGGPEARAAPGPRPGEALPAGGPGAVAGMATGAELEGREPERIRVVETPPRDLEREGWRRTAGIGVIPLDKVQDLVEPRRSVGMEHVVQRLSPRLGVVWERPVAEVPLVAAPPVEAGEGVAPPVGPPPPPAPPAGPPPEPPEGQARPTDPSQADPAEPLVAAVVPPATGGPPRPPNIGNPLVPPSWRAPEPDVVEAWRLAQRAEATMQWGRVFGEHLLRQFRRSIPAPYHFRASEYLDTGDAELLAGVPDSVRTAVDDYRALMERYAAYAQASGELAEGQVIEHYFTHLLQGPERAVVDASRRFANARQHSPFFRERTIPTLTQLERWLEQEGFAARGVRVVRDPALVARAYVTAYHRAEALREMANDLVTSVTREGHPVLMGAEQRGALTDQPSGYVSYEHPLLRAAVGNQLPLLDERYAAPIHSALTPSSDPPKWLASLDTLNNLHRGIVMALPWKHGLLNVGMDAMMLTGLWRGVVHGEWLSIRRDGYRMLRELDPFVERLVTDGELRLPLVHAPLEEVRRSLSEMIRDARLPWTRISIPGAERLAGFWEQVERWTWEKMVSGWTIGLAKLLYDRANQGRLPHVFGRVGITQEAWASLNESEKMKAIGRVVTLLSGQLPRTMFKDPNLLQRLRWVMFSPSWNTSNLAMMQAVFRAEGGFALRGLRPAERTVVETFAEAYGARSVVAHYLLSAVLQLAVGLALTGTLEWIWDNPPGYRTRIWMGNDHRGRGRFAMSPFGYLVKDLENVVHAGWRLAQLDWKPAGQLTRSKLALAPKVAIMLTGYLDPFDSWIKKLEGRGLGDRLLDGAEAIGDEFVPITAFERDPTAAIETWLGISIRHGLTSKILRGRLGIEMRDFGSAIRWAERNRPGMVERLQRQRERREKELTTLIQSYERYEETRTGEGPVRRMQREGLAPTVERIQELVR